MKTFQKLFNENYLARLDNIHQWLEWDVHQSESVSQHSFKVVMFTMSLLDDTFSTGGHEEVLRFKGECLRHAVLHDFDEAILRRDISHEVKYNPINGDEIRAELDRFSDTMCKQKFGEDSELYADAFKPNPVVKSFVKLCDWYAMLYFIRREQKMGNENLDSRLEYCVEKINDHIDSLNELLKESFPNTYLNLINQVNIM